MLALLAEVLFGEVPLTPLLPLVLLTTPPDELPVPRDVLPRDATGDVMATEEVAELGGDVTKEVDARAGGVWRVGEEGVP